MLKKSTVNLLARKCTYESLRKSRMLSVIDKFKKETAMDSVFVRLAVTSVVIGLSACGGGGSSSPDKNPISLSNKAPIAQIKADRLEIVAYDAITLSGENSKDPDGDALNYQWEFFDENGTQVSFRISNENTGTIKSEEIVKDKRFTFNPDQWGSYVVKLTVSDGKLSHTTQQSIEITPHRRDYPTANIAQVETGKIGATIWLVGDQSTGAFGQQITYHWALTTAPENSQADLTNSNQSRALFIPDVAGNYELNLTVTHVGDKLTDSKAIHLQVDELTENSVPVAVIEHEERNYSLGETVKLDASKSYDADGDALTYEWQWQNKPASSDAKLTINREFAQFTSDVTGPFEVKLIVSDTKAAAQQIAQVNVVNDNVAPTANAGQDVSLNISDYTVLDGKASSDPENHTLRFEWSLISKPDGSQYDALDSPSLSIRSDHTFQPDVTGEFVFQLRVYDGELYSAIDTVIVSVFENARPVAVLPKDFVVYNDDKITIDGSKSYDEESKPLTYKWSFKNTPNYYFGSLETLNEKVSFTPTEEGTYTIKLIVNDGEQDSMEETIVVVRETPVFKRTVTGRFVDQGGNPIAGVEIEGVRGTKASANANGEFTITLQSEREHDGVFNTIDLTYGLGTEVNFNLMTYPDGDVNLGDFVLPVHQWKDITITSCAGYTGDSVISLTFATITPETPELLFRTNIEKLFTVDGSTARVMLPASSGSWAVFYHTSFKYNVSTDDSKVYFIHDYQADDSLEDLVNLNVCDNK